MSIFNQFRKAWRVFAKKDEYVLPYISQPATSRRPDLRYFSMGNERSIVVPLYTRIGVDTAAIAVKHVRLDKNGQFVSEIDSGLNNCLSVEANIDQSGRAFIQDVAMSLCDEGVVAIVPVDTTTSPIASGSYDILTMRVGRIIQWFPSAIEVRVYNDRNGSFENVRLPKTVVAIVENPLYPVMNAPNSTLRRLIEKLRLLDAVDRQSGAGKLDLIIQLPFVIKSEARQKQADIRRQAIIDQLRDGQYGIAYTDATEKITQLNRPAENNLMAQVEYLTRMLYSQLGLTSSVFDGTADEGDMLNYYNRTIEPIVGAIADAMHRTFLTKTARTQGQAVRGYRSAFRYIAPKDIPEMADKLTRNEVFSPNEIRGVIGWYPSEDPAADELRNRNLNQQVQNGSDFKLEVSGEGEYADDGV